MRVFVRILVLHAVIMYLLSWYIDHKHAQFRLSRRVNRTLDKLQVAELPAAPTRTGLRKHIETLNRSI